MQFRLEFGKQDRTRANPQWRQLTEAGQACTLACPKYHFADALADAGFSDNRGAVGKPDIHATYLAASIAAYGRKKK